MENFFFVCSNTKPGFAPYRKQSIDFQHESNGYYMTERLKGALNLNELTKYLASKQATQ